MNQRCCFACRGFKLQGSFLFLGINAAAIAAAKAADKHTKVLWSLSSGLLFAVFPYTMLAHMPTTNRILRQVRQLCSGNKAVHVWPAVEPSLNKCDC
jgi:hypothetical protein